MSHRIETERLLLRLPEPADIPELVRLVGEWDVAKNLGRVPYPYSQADASMFFDQQEQNRANGTDATFAIARKSDAAYIGGCGVHLRDNGEFEIGYWIGKPYWGNGYATEAARVVAAFAFDVLQLETLTAAWFVDNAASGRVLEKLGSEPCGMGERDCRSRGRTVRCHNMILTRAAFVARKAA